MSQLKGSNSIQIPTINIPIPKDMDSLKDTFLNILDWAIPIDETCKTLYQMIENGEPKTKFYLILSIMIICGLQVALFGERFKIISTAIIIFFGITFTSTHILKSVFNLALDSLQEFHSNNPIIYFFIQFILAFILAFIIHYFLSNVLTLLTTLYFSFIIYRKVEKYEWASNLSKTMNVFVIIAIVIIVALIIFLMSKFALKICTVAFFSIYGVIYTFISVSIFTNIFTNGKYLYGPEDIRESVLNQASIVIICSIIICFLIQLFYPLKKRK